MLDRLKQFFRKLGLFIQRIFGWIASGLNPLWNVILTIRFPFFVTVLLCYLFFIDQTLEILRVMANETSRFNFRFWFGSVAAVAVSLGAWYFARLQLDMTRATRSANDYEKFLARHLPRLLGSAICFFLGIAAFVARPKQKTDLNDDLFRLGVVQLVFAALLLVFFKRRRVMMERHPRRREIVQGLHTEAKFRLSWGQWFPVAIANGTFLLGLILFSFAPVQTAPLLGPLAVLILGVGSWIPLGSFVAYAGLVYRIPFLTTLLVAAFFFTWRDWNDNHGVRTLRSSAPPRVWAIGDYFQQWLASRPDRGASNYPVFLVATEGGGIRAAYNTAMILGELQSRYPAFYDHLFAISGVSGGSVGATIFAASAKNMVEVQKSGTQSMDYHEYYRRLFTRDFLSPLLSRGLFPDLLQRFFFPGIGFLDRARGLEFAFEDATRFRGLPLLRDSFFVWHEPRGTNFGPALLLNTTEVDTGQRMTLSPFDHHSFPNSRPLSLSNVSDQADISLSSAMILSARFPVFTPPGYFFQSGEGKKHRFVDGGYYENSGTATLLDLYSALKPRASTNNCRFYVIRIGHELLPVGNDTTSTNKTSLPKHQTQGFDEFGPVNAILNVREARGDDSTRQIADAYRFAYDADLIDFHWKELDVPIPLGWLISDPACESLDSQFRDCVDAISAVGKALRKSREVTSE